MAALTLTFANRPDERLDLSALTPTRLAGLSLGEIANLAVGTTTRAGKLGDVATLSGEDINHIRIVGGSDRLDCIGTGLKGGAIHVEGDAGRLLGSKMISGAITVTGSVGPLAGSAMTGGRIDIAGSADERLGGATHGAMSGMRGGLIVVAGKAGVQVGDRMKRGVIVVLGGCGDYTGSRMIGGTILSPHVGDHAAALMKRGTLIVGSHGALLPTFVEAGGYELPFLALFRNWLKREASAGVDLVPARALRLRGDMATSGRGEIFVTA